MLRLCPLGNAQRGKRREMVLVVGFSLSYLDRSLMTFRTTPIRPPIPRNMEANRRLPLSSSTPARYKAIPASV